MKKLVVLLAGLSLLGNVALGDGNTEIKYDLVDTELKFYHDLYNQNNGSFYTRDSDNTLKLNLNVTKDNTVLGLGAEFSKDGEDALTATLNHKIFDRLEVQVKGELNFGASTGGFQASKSDDVFVKYTPEKLENLELGFYPYDIDMTIGDELEIEYKGTDVDGATDEIKVPGIRFTYKGSDNSTIKLGIGSRQNGKSTIDADKKENIYHIHAAYVYDGDKLNLEAAGVFNTQDDKNVVSNNDHSIAGYEYAANVMGGYKFTEKLSAKAEIATAKEIVSGSKTGYGYFVELEYDTDWTFDSKADSSVYANINHQDKYFLDGIGNDGLTSLELGMNFTFDNVTMTPLVSYEKAGEKVFEDINGEATDNNFILGFKIAYSI